MTDVYDIRPYLKSTEVACPCCGVVLYDDLFVNKLSALRMLLDRPFKYNSFYRCVPHNEEVGGDQVSLHLDGKACDIDIVNWHTTQIHYLVRYAIILGLSVRVYATHVHLSSSAYPIFKYV